MEKLNKKYFLAANSSEGFISYFKNCYNPADGWKCYIIKGGPGTGKSSFMKHLVFKSEEKGIEAELFPCSSDPDSLDAVIFPALKTVIMDGTAPHTVDPDFPGVCETILNFSSFWNEDMFRGKEKSIMAVTYENKMLHRSAAEYIRAAGGLLSDNFKLAKGVTDDKKVLLFAEKLCRKYIPRTKGNSYEWVRFLGGITPKGVVCYTNTAVSGFDNKVIIRDENGSVSGIIMEKIREHSLSCGYEIITVRNPFYPSALIDHIIIPELSLCFLREYCFAHFNCDIRRIHSRRFMDLKKLHKNHQRMKFNKKVAEHLLVAGCEILKEAKAVHDKIEKYYIDAMDFGSLTKFAEEFSRKLFN